MSQQHFIKTKCERLLLYPLAQSSHLTMLVKTIFRPLYKNNSDYFVHNNQKEEQLRLLRPQKKNCNTMAKHNKQIILKKSDCINRSLCHQTKLIVTVNR